MTRLKNIRKPRPRQHAKSPAPQESVNRAIWTVVVELGASNGQAMLKKPDGEWELVRWAQGVSASSVGGAEAIPALTAIRKSGQPREILHGHAAVRARKRNPGDWEMFAYPKLVFMDERSAPNIQRTLELQKEKAKAFGMTSKEIAIAFFRQMISEVIGHRNEMFKIYVNISDRWPNSNVQELMLSFQGIRADIEFENVDECLSSIVGRISNGADGVSAGGVYVVVDCGHSTMSVGLAEVASGPRYKVHRYEEHSAGAGEINMAVEDAVRAINRANGAKSSETNVWEVSECIDEYFKPEPDNKISAQCGLSEDEWETVMDRAELANRSLDRRRPHLTRQTLADALDLVNRLGSTDGPNVLLTGRGSRSPTSQKAFRDLVDREFRTATIHDDKETHITAVLAGLMRIADQPEILSVKQVPVSLWLRSDPDEMANEEDCNTVVRICTQGQDKTDRSNVRDRTSASHPIHYELSAPAGQSLSLDLSVFGTPAGVADETIVKGWNADNFAYADIDQVVEFGKFEQQLPSSTVGSGKNVFHVYLYVELSRLSVEFYAVFARDGRQVRPLEKTPFEEAFRNGELSSKWEMFQGVSMDMVRLKQVARPESLSTNAREVTTLGVRKPEAPGVGTSPSNTSAMEVDEIWIGQGKKRAPPFRPRSKARLQKQSIPPTTTMITPSNGNELDLDSMNGDSGPDMEL